MQSFFALIIVYILSLTAVSSQNNDRWASYAGYYHFSPDNHDVHVTFQDGKLYLQPPGDPRFAMEPLNDSTFLLPQGIQIIFRPEVNQSGYYAEARHPDRPGQVIHLPAVKRKEE